MAAAFDSGAFQNTAFEAAAGGGGPASYTLVCAQGAYSITGASAALVAQHRVTAAQGVYVLTGQPAATVAARNLVAAPGAYSITGNAASLVYVPPGVTMSAAGGAYALTGNSVQMRAARRLVADSGSYLLTGSAVPTPGEAPPTVVGGGGGVSGGSLRDIRAYADLLDKARPTKAAKKRRRKELVAAALELLPDEPQAVEAAEVIAKAIVRKEVAAIERWTPPRAMLPVAVPVPEFDAHEALRLMVAQWIADDAMRRQLEDEEDVEMLLLG